MKRIIIISVVSAWIIISGMLWDVLNQQNFSFQVKQKSVIAKNNQMETLDALEMN